MAKKKEVNVSKIIQDNKQQVYVNPEETAGYYKMCYTALIYETLYKLASGEHLDRETNFSRMLTTQFEYAMKQSNTIAVVNLLKLLISSCPSQVKEGWKNESKEEKVDIEKMMKDLK